MDALDKMYQIARRFNADYTLCGTVYTSNDGYFGRLQAELYDISRFFLDDLFNFYIIQLYPVTDDTTIYNIYT